MRKLAFSIKILFSLIFIIQIQLIWGQGFGTLPLSECWRIERENINSLVLASDNDNDLYLSDSDGFIESVDKFTGQIIWKTEIGGEIIPKVVTDSQNLYVLSKNLSLNKSEDKDFQEINLRSLSIVTGITNWQKTLKVNLDDDLFLFEKVEKLYLITKTGSIIIFSKQDGESKLEIKHDINISSFPFFIDDKIYVGTTDNTIKVFSALNGKLIKSFDVPGTPKSIFTNGTSVVFVGDAAGNISALDSSNSSQIWKTWAGAEITNITKAPKGLLVSSFDNYVYLISEKNGKRIWKKRLLGRSIGNPLIKDNVAVFSTFGGTDASFIELNKGKAINRLLIEEENYFIDNPKGSAYLIFFPTQKGIFAYGTRESCKRKK